MNAATVLMFIAAWCHHEEHFNRKTEAACRARLLVCEQRPYTAPITIFDNMPQIVELNKRMFDCAVEENTEHP